MKSKFMRGICVFAAMCLCLCAHAEVISGEKLLEVEQMLYALGYHDENCDAQLDEDTRLALRSFQIANGLTVTGEPDAATVALLESGECVGCHDYLMNLAGEYVDLPLLQSGSVGDSVVQMQRKLRDLGYFSGQCDGVFGDATMAAVARFQLANGLTETGMADRSTQMRLNEGRPIGWAEFLESTVCELGDSDVHVRLLQRELQKLGYFAGECTGNFGELTQQAVIRFQAGNGLDECGVATVETCGLLYSGNAVPMRDVRTLNSGDSDPAVADLQSKLAALGYFDRSITGIYGATTETAVRLFQLANGLPATGEADPATLARVEGGAIPMDDVRENFRAQVSAQTDSARAVIGGVAAQVRGQSFEGDDEDLYEGFAFVQYVCVAAGIPVVSAEDIVKLISDPVEDPSVLQPGDVLVYRTDDMDGMHLLLAVSAGGGRAIFATPESGYVLETAVENWYGGRLYRWNLGAGE